MDKYKRSYLLSLTPFNINPTEHKLLERLLVYCSMNSGDIEEYYGDMEEKSIEKLAEKLGVEIQ